jgi:hypothetical protein
VWWWRENSELIIGGMQGERESESVRDACGFINCTELLVGKKSSALLSSCQVITCLFYRHSLFFFSLIQMISCCRAVAKKKESGAE